MACKNRYFVYMIMGWLFVMPGMIWAQKANKPAINAIPIHAINDNSSFQLKQDVTPLVAIVFLSPECPLSQNYMLTLNELQKSFGANLSIIGVFPGSDYNDITYQNFEKKYLARFPLFKDENKLLTRELGATITPEVFLLNASREIIYQGAIDDWVISLGKKRRVATDHYLKNAISFALAGHAAVPSRTTAIGCFINLK